MYAEAWIVLSILVMYIIYFTIMSFVSKYYKDRESWGLGHVANVTWMLLVGIVVSVLLVFNVQCTIDGNCRPLAITITVLVAMITFAEMGWGIYKTISYDKKR